MALDIDTSNRPKRPVGFGIIGVALMLFSGYLFYELEQQKADTIYVPSSYEYSITQSVRNDVTYLDSSFYKNGPGVNNSAYVRDLTNKINTTVEYQFSSNDTANLTYTYDVKAKVLGKYAIKADSENTANVWSREYVLVSPTSKTVTTKQLTLTPTADMPFMEYKQAIDNFKLALELPLNSEAQLMTTIKVDGSINGTPFTDTRVVTVSAPLDQPIYTLGVKYDKSDTKHIVGESAKSNREQFQRYLMIFAVSVGVLGVGMLLYGLRRQIFKTPYQRELEKIYRYNDGIIIRAQRPADLSGKRIVPVLSFEDMLNLEEELKLPIVASPAGGEATKFIIIRDDVAYVFTLGKALIEEEPVDEISETWEDKKPRHRKQK